MFKSLSTQLSERRKSLAFVMLLACSSAAISTLVVSPGIWLDDAFISFRYARNLFEGFGLVYNAGENVEGYTNFLWTIIAYAGLRLGFQPITFAQAVSVCAQVLTVWMVYWLGCSNSRPRYRALIAPLFLAFNISFVSYPMMGMETTFFTMLVTFAVLLYKREFENSRIGAVVIGTVLLAISLTRFDGFVVVGLLLAYKLLIEGNIKSTLPILLIFVIGMSIYHVWRFSYYPTVLPNTYYAKMDFSLDQFRKGITYLVNFLREGGLYMIPLAVVPFATGQATKTIRLVAWVVFVYLLYIVVAGGDWMLHFRFILPVLPLLIFLMQEGIWTIYEKVNKTIPLKQAVRIFSIVLFAILFGFHLLPLQNSKVLSRQSARGFFRGEDARVIGMHLDKALPSDYVVASEWAGVMPFYMQQNVLDFLGLTDREIARNFPGSRMGRAITADYLVSRNPDIIMLCAHVFSSAQKAAQGARLRIESASKDNWIHHFYAALVKPESGYKVCVMKGDEHSFWPLLIRKDLHQQNEFCQESAERSEVGKAKRHTKRKQEIM